MKKLTLIILALFAATLSKSAFAQGQPIGGGSLNEIAACNGAKILFKSETRRDANECITKLTKSEGNLSHYSVKVSVQEVNDFNEQIILESRTYKVQLLDGTVTFISNLE